MDYMFPHTNPAPLDIKYGKAAGSLLEVSPVPTRKVSSLSYEDVRR